MYRYLSAATLCLASSFLWSTDYSFLNEDAFVKQDAIWHFETDYSRVAPAKITTGDTFGTKLRYSEGNASMYFSHFLDSEHALAWQLGINDTDVNWKENPRFNGHNYLYGVTSLSWITYAVQKWRWVINGGVSFDAQTWNFGKSAVYFATLWGRYTQLDNLGIHVGVFAYYGALNGYVLPILGFDWWPSSHFEIRAIVPLDVSISYHFNKHLTTAIMATSMGGPYRFPRRAHGGIGDFDEAIFKIYATTLEWDLKWNQKDFFSIGVAGGWDFGGWIQISDAHNHHKKYYNFNGAPYARVFGSLSF